MRFLKKKIFRAQQAAKIKSESSDLATPSLKSEPDDFANSERVSCSLNSLLLEKPSLGERLRQRLSQQDQKDVFKESDASMKNIAINYGKAIANFATSELAWPYIENRLADGKLKREEFAGFINRQKGKISGICSLRSLLLIADNDDDKTAECKRLFQWIGEVFIKNFSVNWIMHGRMAHKITYLKFRFKMLRRIKDPENFTYIKERSNKK